MPSKKAFFKTIHKYYGLPARLIKHCFKGVIMCLICLKDQFLHLVFSFFYSTPLYRLAVMIKLCVKKYFNEYSHLAIIEIGQTVADTNKKIDTKIGHLKSTLRPFFREDEYEHFKNNNYVEIRKKLNIDSYKDISKYESDIDGVQINITKQNGIIEEHKKNRLSYCQKKKKKLKMLLQKTSHLMIFLNQHGQFIAI